LEKGIEIPRRGATGGRWLCEPADERLRERSEAIQRQMERARQAQDSASRVCKCSRSHGLRIVEFRFGFCSEEFTSPAWSTSTSPAIASPIALAIVSVFPGASHRQSKSPLPTSALVYNHVVSRAQCLLTQQEPRLHPDKTTANSLSSPSTCDRTRTGCGRPHSPYDTAWLHSPPCGRTLLRDQSDHRRPSP
jgi:hypothetical protein